MNTRQASGLLVLTLSFAVLPHTSSAQPTPVTFVHGLHSEGSTWADAITTLRNRLNLDPHAPNLNWTASYETQAEQLNATIPANVSPVLVGHSNGGVISRQLARSRSLAGLVTVGSPHYGAPLLDHGIDLGYYYGELVGILINFGQSEDVFVRTHPPEEYTVNWGTFFTKFLPDTVNWADLARRLALNAIFNEASEWLTDAPFAVLPEMRVGSFFNQTAGAASINSQVNNLVEPLHVPKRHAIVSYQQSNQGGPIRLIDIPTAEAVGNATDYASILAWFAAAIVDINTEAHDADAAAVINDLTDLSLWLGQFNDRWCRAVSDTRPFHKAACQPNDSVVPEWSQYFGAPQTGVGVTYIPNGRTHVTETRDAVDTIYEVLVHEMGVGLKPGVGEGPQGSGHLGNVLFANEQLNPNDSLVSPNGRYALVYQGDGNLVLYDNDINPAHVPEAAIWWPSSFSTPGRALMQDDGNFVVYDLSGHDVWNTFTQDNPGAHLELSDAGVLTLWRADNVPLFVVP